MLNEALTSAFIEGFYGYGDFGARYWFVGMEEGGGGSEDEVERRLNAWDRLGRRQVEDLAEFHAAICEKRWFDRGVLQPTWRGLIRIVLAAKGLQPTIEDVRTYQREHLGRRGGETALLEIMPLPSPTIGAWHYTPMVTSDRLRSRDEYDAAVRPMRLAHIQARINECRPAIVIVYGASRESFAAPPGTRLLRIKHPMARGVTNAGLAAIGRSTR